MSEDVCVYGKLSELEGVNREQVKTNFIREAKTTIPFLPYNNQIVVEVLPKVTKTGIIINPTNNFKDNAKMDSSDFIVVAYGENTSFVEIGDKIIPRQQIFAKIITFPELYVEKEDSKGGKMKVYREFIIMGEYDLAGKLL